jgi:Mor family transcriptional regulator
VLVCSSFDYLLQLIDAIVNDNAQSGICFGTEIGHVTSVLVKLKKLVQHRKPFDYFSRYILADAVGDSAAEKILGKIMSLYGNMQLYIPFERTAFRKIIALEIYERYGKDGNNMNDLARYYGISFTLAYNLWKLGQREKMKPTMPYLPFLEMAGNNNFD